MSLHRRQFLQIAAVSSAGAVAGTACYIPAREVLLQSPSRLPEDLLTLDTHYATSLGGNGALVRVVEGRALKIEGNPDHPVNQGRSNPWMQAQLQMLYHPDRFEGPRQSVSRGTGQYHPISWQNAITDVAAKVRDARGRVLLVTPVLSGAQAWVADRFAQAVGASRLSVEPLEDTVYRAAARAVFGTDQLPDYDLGRAGTILSFGADWLGAWQNQVRNNLGYGEFRQGRSSRGYVIHIDSRFSLTAANADEFVPCRPGTEGILALSIAQALQAARLGDTAAFPAASSLQPYAAATVAQQTGVPAEKITAIARKIAESGPAIVLGGGSAGAQTNGLFNLTQILNLNVLLGSVGRTGGVRFNPTVDLGEIPTNQTPSSFTDWEREVIRLRGLGNQAVVLVYNANPVFDLPGSLGIADAIRGAGTVVSFSSMLDETTELADYVLPSNTVLEDWAIETPASGPGYAVVNMVQPVVNRVRDTRPFGDTLIAVAQQIGADVGRQFNFQSQKDVAREAVRTLYARRAVGSVSTSGSFDEFWTGILQRGGFWSPSQTGTGSARQVSAPTSVEAPRFAGDANEYPYHLNIFADPTFGKDSRSADLPWLQALPDPTTTVSWNTWVEVGTNTAKTLGVVEGDVVTVASPNGQFTASVYINPAQPDFSVAVPFGNGRTAGGRWIRHQGGGLIASNSRLKPMGSNPMAAIAPLTDAQTGGLAWGATRVKISKTGRRENIHKYEGFVTPVNQAGEHMKPVQIATTD